jgi:hypothetical protein
MITVQGKLFLSHWRDLQTYVFYSLIEIWQGSKHEKLLKNNILET